MEKLINLLTENMELFIIICILIASLAFLSLIIVLVKQKKSIQENDVEEELYKIINGVDNIEEAKIKIKNNLDVVVIGDGNKVISQYPSKGTTVIEDDKVFLLTNGNNYTMPNISNWSRYDVIKLCEFIGMEYSFDGYGYVASQSIKQGSKIDKNSKLEVLLGNIKPY